MCAAATHCSVANMSNVSEHLSRWVKAGVLDESTASRIRDYEHDQARVRATSEDGERFERPGVVEALVYLGLVVVSVGALVLLVSNWDQLTSWARIAVVAASTAVTLALGFGLRAMDDSAVRRGGQAAWLVSVALFAVLLAVIIQETTGGIDDEDSTQWMLLIAASSLIYASVLWAIEPSHAQVLAIGGAGFFLAQTAGAWPDEFSVELAAVTGVAIGGTGLVLSELGFMQPRSAARPIFSLVALVTSFMAMFETALAWEFLVFAVAGTLIAAGVARNSFTMLVLGILGAFIGLVSFMFAHFSSEIGAPVALIISGVLLLAAAMITVQARKLMQSRRPA